MRAAWKFAAAAGLALMLGACSSNSSYGSSSATTASPTTAKSAGTSAVVTVEHTAYGSVLANPTGRTLYILTTDSATKSTCSGGCASAWPPLTVSGSPGATGINTAMLTTIKRSDGGSQVVFAGHPLYTFSGDTGPHQTNGEGSGGVWFVISSSGKVVKAKLAGASRAGSTTTSAGSSGGY